MYSVWKDTLLSRQGTKRYSRVISHITNSRSTLDYSIVFVFADIVPKIPDALDHVRNVYNVSV